MKMTKIVLRKHYLWFLMWATWLSSFFFHVSWHFCSIVYFQFVWIFFSLHKRRIKCNAPDFLKSWVPTAPVDFTWHWGAQHFWKWGPVFLHNWIVILLKQICIRSIELKHKKKVPFLSFTQRFLLWKEWCF